METVPAPVGTWSDGQTGTDQERANTLMCQEGKMLGALGCTTACPNPITGELSMKK